MNSATPAATPLSTLQGVSNTTDPSAPLLALLQRQKQAFLQEGKVSAPTRIDRIERLINLVVKHQEALCEAMAADFGHRSRHQSLMADVYATLESLKHAKKHTRQWMKAERRKVNFPLNLLGARARVEYQPKGVVGNIATWNFPVFIALGPLGGIFAAGNRAMVKLSEITPATSALLQTLLAEYFDETECVGITGGPEVGAAFAGLPLDHLIFTGATGIGRHILRAAADNLTPVTLELGGKSPVVVSRSADLQQAADRIITGKALNMGQVCLSPDYVFVPRELRDEFITLVQAQAERMFPTVLDNPDVSSMVNQRHYQRLQGILENAKAQGADIREINPAHEDFTRQTGMQKMPFTLVVEPGDELQVMQEEIFGPLLPIKTYESLDEVIGYINARPRPLALYYFGRESQEERQLLDQTTAGGVTLNDVMAHVSCENLPFGGIGHSGMGNYHGIEGFKTFSHAKSVYRQSGLNLMALGGMLPPYGKKTEAVLKRMIKP